MYIFFKRFFDVLLSAIAIVCLSWLLIPIAVILKCTGEHYVFYKQPRVGQGGKMFDVLKFATMLKDSPNMRGGTTTVRNDPRVLPFGRFLRKTKLNELPQLFNILLGSMSIIGPRPLVPKEFSRYSETDQWTIKQLKPGLSGVASVIFRDEEDYISQAKDPVEFSGQVIQPHKGKLETWYYNHRNLWVDFMIVFLTVWVVLFPQSDLPYRLFKDMPRIDLKMETHKFNEAHA
ncbi:MAG: sugar transferase [Bacteroidales bacterium]|nr:sugar transferase [Bacteroidales bacterium]